MAINFYTKSGEEQARIARVPLGDLAVKLLKVLGDDKAVAVCNWNGGDIEFYTFPFLKRYTPFKGEESVRLNTAFEALIKRGWMEGISPPYENKVKVREQREELVRRIKEASTDQNWEEYQERDREGDIPWFGKMRILGLNQEGMEALVKYSSRIARLEEDERRKQESPRFLVTKGDGNSSSMAGGIYRIKRQGRTKIWIEPTKPEDNSPSKISITADQAVSCIENFRSGRIIDRYVRTRNVLLSDISMEEYTQLWQATKAYKVEKGELSKQFQKKILEGADQTHTLEWYNGEHKKLKQTLNVVGVEIAKNIRARLEEENVGLPRSTEQVETLLGEDDLVDMLQTSPSL